MTRRVAVVEESARRVAAARDRHQRGVAETAAGRPVAGARQLLSALDLLRGVHTAQSTVLQSEDESEPELAGAIGRVLLSLAHAEAEQGRTRRGLARLDEAERLLPDDRGLVLQQRGLMLLRLGREQEALGLLDAAVHELTGDRLVLARTLLNRGNLHTYAGRVTAARADLIRCRDIALADGWHLLAAKATHNLGSCELISGDVPAALRAYEAAADRYRLEAPGLLAVVAVDRARALLAAGLAADAGRELDEALEISRRLRLEQDYAEAELGRAQAALVVGDADTARQWAGRAQRRFGRRGNPAWAALAELARVRADVQDGPASAVLAGRCQRLAGRLRALGLPHDADRADLLAARQLNVLGRRADANRVLAGTARRGGPLETRLLRWLVAAELARDSGDRQRMFDQARTGLAVLHEHRTRYGSIDLQAGASALGAALADTGLTAALETGSPRLVFDWSERARAQAFRIRPVRPPADPVLAAALGELRQLRHTGRQLELCGRRDPALRARGVELERLVQARGWQVSGSGDSSAPATLAEVGTALGSEPVMICLHTHSGRMVALVLQDGTATVVRLGSAGAVREANRRLLSDLDLLAGEVPEQLAPVVHASARHQLSVLSAEVFAPLRCALADRPVVVVSVTAVPWTLVPELRGRPVTVAPSASVWLNATRRAAAPPPDAAPVLVAGPYLAHAESEVDRIAALRPGSTVLRGAASTVDSTLRALDGTPLAHLATHGHHAPENVLFSRLDLADGPLMAYDLATLRQPPRQVVLSACEVGRADVWAGEEVFGFTAALLHAGTPTVVASICRVPDQAALSVMTDYHRALAGGRSPAAALAEALPADGLVPFSCFGAG